MNNDNYNDKFYERILSLVDEGKTRDEIQETLGSGRQVHEALLSLDVLQFTRDAIPDTHEPFARLMEDVTELTSERYTEQVQEASIGPFRIIINTILHRMKSRTWIFSAATAMIVVVVVAVSAARNPGLPDGGSVLLVAQEDTQIVSDAIPEIAGLSLGESLAPVVETGTFVETSLVVDTPSSLDGLLTSLDDLLENIEEDSGTEDLVLELADDLSQFDNEYDF
ncbi:MAG: hypothetical protein ACI83D_000673 [Planctomycetota bacterium]|jgi:hypothetical protein